MKPFGLLLLLLYCTYSDAQIAWEKAYGGPNHAIYTNITYGPGNCFFLCGSDTSGSVTRALLTKLDGSGNVLWNRNYTTLDSQSHFDNILLLDSNHLIIQSGNISISTGGYYVPKLLMIDTSGNVVDSMWPDISNVYNGTGNINLYKGASQTFWSFIGIDLIGISNETRITRLNNDLDTIRNFHEGAYYDHLYSYNNKGEAIFDVFMDEYDSITQTITQPDHVALLDSAGNTAFDSIYFALQPSKNILRNEDGGFNLFYIHPLTIRRFDQNGVQQQIKNYNIPCDYAPIVTPSLDSGYFMVISNYDVVANEFSINILKFNNADDTLWTQKFFRPYVYDYTSLTPTLDGGAAILFRTGLYGDSINYVVRIGPNGERFPYTFRINPYAYCYGDTVTLTTQQPAAGYLWSTGDTTAVLHVTTTGNYGLTVTDSSANSYSLHPVYLQFDSIPPITLNDVHTCATSVHLSMSGLGLTTYWVYNDWIYTGPTENIYAHQVPDTIPVWVILQSHAGCRASDSAYIFFDDCTGIEQLQDESDVILAQTGPHSFYVTTRTTNIDRINLVDLTGKSLMLEQPKSTTVSLDLSFISPGFYFLECDMGFRMKVLKIYIAR